ncbi:MAG: L-serine ammonia-lyase, iron-sulfur-dependent, subunit alpha [Mobilitalea sp.]
MRYDSVKELCSKAQERNMKISELVLEDQALFTEKSKEELLNNMRSTLEVMKASVKEGMISGRRSVSGLTGGDALKMKKAVEEGRTLCGPVFGNALSRALSISECNACMGKIVAAPTAGSCGVLPAVLLTIAEDKKFSEEQITLSLFTASGIGMVIANKASVSGAEGGCQAEIGSASAMAAAALVELSGGTPDMSGHACAIALKNILGLVCDPVAGLVEIPCIKRNAMGVANALVAAELTLAGIESKIPVDEVIAAMKKVGDSISPALRETAEGGLAATPTAKRYFHEVFGN